MGTLSLRFVVLAALLGLVLAACGESGGGVIKPASPSQPMSAAAAPKGG